MNTKKIVYESDALSQMKKGIDKVYGAVSSTLGPNGHNVLIETENGKIISTKDGVTVAKSIKLEDSVENMGAQFIINSSIHTNKIAGDGTTTATVLTHSIITEGLKRLDTNINVFDLKRGLEQTKDVIIDELDNMKKDIVDENDYENVATISANGDDKIGRLISEAFKSVGTDGVITVEKSNTGLDELEIVDGLQFNSGYLSPLFINNEQSLQVEFDNPRYIFFDGKLQTVTQILKLLEYSATHNIPLVIVADDISNEALSILIVNKVRGIANVCAVKAPGYGDLRKEMLQDMATLTNGIVVSADRGMEIENITDDVFNDDGELIQTINNVFGTSRSFTSTNKQSTIIDGNGELEKIELRIDQLQSQIEKSVSDYEKQRYRERLGKMSGGVAIINVGGESDVEIEDKKFRIEDALNATKSAIEDGVLPGGGIALMKIWDKLENETEYSSDILENVISRNIMLKAIKQPFMKIIDNAGLNGDVIWSELHTSNDLLTAIENKNNPIELNDGFNVKTKKYVNMITDGVIDPTKVVKTALQKATSLASTFLMTNAIIVDIPTETKPEEMQY